MPRAERAMAERRGRFSFALVVSAVLVLHGALPFVAMPTLGQAVWTMGFSQSFVNQSLLSIHALNFGAPAPAFIAFGLAGAYPSAVFMALGLHPADAYSAMVALWLGLGCFGAWRVALNAGASTSVAAVATLLWMSLPVVWAHAGYSMVSLGMALLPFYFWAALRLFRSPSRQWAEASRSAALYLAACIISVFMDGYTFVMFAVGATLLAAHACLRSAELRRYLFAFALPVHIAAFALAYSLYSAYIGKSQFDASPLDFFRGWGVDLTFLAIPTKGGLWLCDVLGLSVPRSTREHFGDASVWQTTFLFPLMAVGLVAWLRTRRRSPVATAFLVIALVGTYLSMGPSLKLNSIRSAGIQLSAQVNGSMPAEAAIGPTGSAWLSENVPGFKNMRASYRWLALGALGFWLLVVLLLSDLEATRQYSWLWSISVLLIALNLPHLVRKTRESVALRDNFLQLDRSLLGDLGSSLRPGERVAFLPYGNDFLANYLAARTGVRAYNVGGDKNLATAMEHWPQTMLQFRANQVDGAFAERVLLFLARGEVDAIVLPYFDLLWSAHLWPCKAEVLRTSTVDLASVFGGIEWQCPSEVRAGLAPAVAVLTRSPYLSVEARDLYAVIRLAPGLPSQASAGELAPRIRRAKIDYPIRFEARSPELVWVLHEGWNDLETAHVWSTAHAALDLPVPQACSQRECVAAAKFGVFGASQTRPVAVTFRSMDEAHTWSARFAADGSTQEVRIPLPKDAPGLRVAIDVPEATSPNTLTGSVDGRVLGVSLTSIELVGQ